MNTEDYEDRVFHEFINSNHISLLYLQKIGALYKLNLITLKKNAEDPSNVVFYLNKLSESQHVGAFRGIFVQTLLELFENGWYDVIAECLQVCFDFIKTKSVWLVVLALLKKCQDPKMLTSLGMLCRAMSELKFVVPFFYMKPLLWILVDNPQGVWYVPEVLNAPPSQHRWDHAAEYIDYLFSKTNSLDAQDQVCDELLKNSRFVVENLNCLNKAVLHKFKYKASMKNYQCSVEILDSFNQCGVNVVSKGLCNLGAEETEQFIHLWCCVNCVLRNVWFSLQDISSKTQTLFSHVKSKNYACVLNFLKVAVMTVPEIIEVCVSVMIADPEPCKVILEGFLSYFQQGGYSFSLIFGSCQQLYRQMTLFQLMRYF